MRLSPRLPFFCFLSSRGLRECDGSWCLLSEHPLRASPSRAEDARCSKARSRCDISWNVCCIFSQVISTQYIFACVRNLILQIFKPFRPAVSFSKQKTGRDFLRAEKAVGGGCQARSPSRVRCHAAACRGVSRCRCRCRARRVRVVFRCSSWKGRGTEWAVPNGPGCSRARWGREGRPSTGGWPCSHGGRRPTPARAWVLGPLGHVGDKHSNVGLGARLYSPVWVFIFTSFYRHKSR